MAFLYPGFLFALLALAIPVIIHLFNFRQYKKVYFSNVQFLKDLQKQQSSRSNLKNRLILAARLLALTFLVLAFARPFLPVGNQQNVGKQQAVSIFVDNSYSMQTLNREGSLLDEAKRRAKEIASAYSVNDRFQLITQDFEGKQQRFLNRDEFNQAVDEVKISPQSQTLTQVLERQKALFESENNAVPTVYLISDFQKNLAKNSISANNKTKVTLVRIKANPLPNIAVDSVWLLSPLHQPNAAEKLVVRLHNYGDEKAQKVPVKLLINGQTKALGSYDLNAKSMRQDTLQFSGLKPGWQKGELSLNDNPVTFDNHFYFTFQVQQQLPVLQIADQVPNKYLSAVFASDAFFKADFSSAGNVNYSGLNRYPVIYFSDVKEVSAGLAQQLQNYVKQGGTLVVFPAADANLASYKNLLQPLQADFPEKLLNDSTKVTAINLKHPLFKEVFEKMPQNPDLPQIKKYYALSSGQRNLKNNLLELPGRTTFLSVYSSGKGKVYLSAVPLDETFSNLPRHALFVPLLFRMALLSGHNQPLFYTLGENELMEIAPIAKMDEQPLHLQKGQISLIPDVRQVNGNTVLYVADQIHETGDYQLTRKDSVLAQIAFNDNRQESDLNYLSDQELNTNFSAIKTVSYLPAGKLSLTKQVAEVNSGVQLWKLCLILALLFLAAEVLLIRFYKVNRQQTMAV
ncbi:BatA domain-containing protein [uncultured Mucilaginibacter sp.]|uniref:BatA domain-containing protein n=1 Tax=uncultured Mucilaginibacter sp. TaxID=797541 RepID=UPI00260B74AA|nr:BatA domain-containing protein [uncultured Mucilaginibacter sp.]